MLLEIDHHSGVPIYLQVIRQIRRQIMTDGLKTGQQLESVRELAGRIKVNPMTISKAYSLLEAEGLLERRRGVGLFAAKVKKGKRQEVKQKILSDIVNKAVVTAVQLDISQEEAVKLFEKNYREYNDKNRRQK